MIMHIRPEALLYLVLSHTPFAIARIGPRPPQDPLPGVTVYNSYPVVDTEQADCYDSYGSSISCTGSGADGEYKLLPSEYCDNRDGTITDMNTGLMWSQEVFGNGLTYDQMLATLPLSLGGYTDWRMPTIKELYTLSQFNGFMGHSEADNIPYIDTSVFEVEYGSTRFIDSQLMTSTKYLGNLMNNPNSECHFGYNHVDGRVKCYGLESTEKRVRWVRGNSNIGVNDFSSSGAIVTDSATGLKWMKYDSAHYTRNSVVASSDMGDGRLDWQEALDFCANIQVDGQSGWRLPDAHELQSIVDYSRSPENTGSAAIDDIFDATQIYNEANEVDYGWYWTGTDHGDGSGRWAVYIAFGRAMGDFITPDGDYVGPVDVHGAGAQRSDPKTADDTNFSPGDAFGFQGDFIRVYNMVRCVRGKSNPSPESSTTCGPRKI